MIELPKDSHLLQQLVLAAGVDCGSRPGMEQRPVLAEAALAEIRRQIAEDIRKTRRCIRYAEGSIFEWVVSDWKQEIAVLIELAKTVTTQPRARDAGENS